jgi:hypothetical protein
LLVLCRHAGGLLSRWRQRWSVTAISPVFVSSCLGAPPQLVSVPSS